MEFETAIYEKQVKIAELQAEAAKAQQVKRSQADAESRVIAAKAESDAMQYTLPLKQKQIEQSKLEAQARKEATVENADAAAQCRLSVSEDIPGESYARGKAPDIVIHHVVIRIKRCYTTGDLGAQGRTLSEIEVRELRTEDGKQVCH